MVGSGLSVNFTVDAFGTAPLRYQWWKNHEPIIGATNRSLPLIDVHLSDSGLYFLEVTNDFGSVTSGTARLTVAPGLEIRRIGGIGNIGWVDTLDVVDDLAFVGVSANGGGLQIFNVADASAPVLLGGLPLASVRDPVSVCDVVVSGTRAYLAASSRGLHILDVSDPTHPLALGQFATSGNALDLIIREPIAYVAAGRNVLVLDVSNPAKPTQVASYGTSGSVYTLDLDGGILYAAATTDGVHVLDVSEPTSPKRLSRLEAGAVDTVKVRDDRAYVSGSSGPYVFEVAYPEFPSLLGRAFFSTWSHGMTVSGHLIFDGGRPEQFSTEERLAVFDTVNLPQIIPIAAIPTAKIVEAVEIRGNRIYVALSGAGVDILEIGSARDAPLILSHPQAIRAVAGAPAELRVEAVGGANLRYQWFKDGAPIDDATNRTLRMGAVTEGDVAAYSVTVENEIGTVQSDEASLELVEAPALDLVGVWLGDVRGPWLTLTGPVRLQAQLFGTSDFVNWQPLWYGCFNEATLEVLDPVGYAPFRGYRLLLGAR
jgi:hypothetical protein